MKVAVCLSGICRGDISKNLEIMKEHFPYDYYFATWKNSEIHESIKDEVFYIDEPDMHYHPILDVEKIKHPKLQNIKKEMLSFGTPLSGKKYKERILHHTKQIIIHNELLKLIPDDYDMIIRIRYDTRLSKKVDFSKYLKMSYDKKLSIGFGTRTSRYKNFNDLYEIPKIYIRHDTPDSVSRDWSYYLMDPMIFHPRSMFKDRLVKKLHKQKKLLPAEYGWYQILSEPYGDNHLSVYGGAQIEKYL